MCVIYTTLVVFHVHKGQRCIHETDFPETRFSQRNGRVIQSETSFHSRYPDVPVGQLATSLFTAGHPLEIRNGFKRAINVFITDFR